MNYDYKKVFANSYHMGGIYKGLAIYDGSNTYVYIPEISTIHLSPGELVSKKKLLHTALWSSKEMQQLIDINTPTPVQCIFEIGNNNQLMINGYFGNGLKAVGQVIYTAGIHYNENDTYEIYPPGKYLGSEGGSPPAGSSSSSSGGGGQYSGATTPVNPANIHIIGGTVTLEQLASFDKKSYLEFACPIYKEYCKQFGIKYPGVLALQPFYEVNANFPKETSNVARKDNNLGGLKYSSGIPGVAGRGTSVPSNETGGNYSHFNSVSDYYYAHTWQVAKYSNAMSHQESVTAFARCMLAMWVKGITGSPNSPVSYSESLLSDYVKYGLSVYEN